MPRKYVAKKRYYYSVEEVSVEEMEGDTVLRTVITGVKPQHLDYYRIADLMNEAYDIGARDALEEYLKKENN
jgi:hypothetical protein